MTPNPEALKKEVEAQLKSIVERLGVILDAPKQPGEAASVRLTPIPESLQLTTLIPTDLSLTWVTREVMLKTGDDLPVKLPAQAAAAAAPGLGDVEQLILSPKPLPVGDRLEMPSGIPGVIGQLVGSLPTSVSLTLPIKAEVTWQAEDDGENALGEELAFPHDPVEGLSAAFFLAPEFVPLTDEAPPVTNRVIAASVKLSVTLPTPTPTPAAPEIVVEAKTIRVPLPVPAVPVPAVLAMFTHNHFDLTRHGNVPGGIAVFVPPSQPFYDITAVIGALDPLAALLGQLAGKFKKLTRIADVALAVGALNRLIGLLRAASNTDGVYFVVRPTWEEPEFHEVKFPNGFDCGKEFGSLIFLGPPSSWLSFFIRPGFEDEEGAFEISFAPVPTSAEPAAAVPVQFRAKTIIVEVENLHTEFPATRPGEALFVAVESKDKSFGDRLSSFKFERRP